MQHVESRDQQGGAVSESLAVTCGRLLAPSLLLDFAVATAADVAAGVAECGWVGIWRLVSGEVLAQWRLPSAAPTRVAISEDGRRILVALEHDGQKGGESDTVFLCGEVDVSNRLEIATMLGGDLFSFLLIDRGREFLAGFDNGRIERWALRPSKRLGGYQVDAPCAAFSHAGFAASFWSQGRVVIWDWHDGRRIRELRGPTFRWMSSSVEVPHVNHVVFSADGRRLLAVTGASSAASSVPGVMGVVLSEQARRRVNRVTSWDLLSGELVSHSDDMNELFPLGLQTAAVSPDGRLALIGGYDFKIRLWDLDHNRSLGCVSVLNLDDVYQRRSERFRANPHAAEFAWYAQLAFSYDGKHALIHAPGQDFVQVVALREID